MTVRDPGGYVTTGDEGRQRSVLPFGAVGNDAREIQDAIFVLGREANVCSGREVFLQLNCVKRSPNKSPTLETANSGTGRSYVPCRLRGARVLAPVASISARRGAPGGPKILPTKTLDGGSARAGFYGWLDRRPSKSRTPEKSVLRNQRM